jgi:long-chain acyl-CoA synthetase
MRDLSATLAQAFDNQAEKHGGRVFLKDKYKKAWHEHSWEEIADAAHRLRAGLIRLGVKAGDRVAILSDNCPQWVIVDQAVLGMGAVVVPLYTTSGIEETRHVLTDSGASIVTASGDECVKRTLALAATVSDVRAVIAMHRGAVAQDPAATAPPVMTLASASAATPAATIEGSRHDPATIIYTSGTTGPPKGAMLSHGNILANCEAALEALAIDEHDITLSFLPVAHSFERTAGYYAVTIAGGSIAYAEGLMELAQNLLEIQPTILLTVPRLLEVIYNRVAHTVETSSPLRRALFGLAARIGGQAAEYRHHGLPVPAHLALAMVLFRKLVFEKISAIFGSRIRYVISGGAPLAPEIFRLLAAAEVPIVEGYGLTEAAPVVSTNLHGKTRIGTVGRPLPGVEVNTAADGELLVRGANVMKGYYKREAETAEAIDAQGWLHTGDIAQIDPEGYITITDRKKEIIVLSGGKNVSPAYIENRLTRDPYIAQACVVGDRRKHLAVLLVPNFEKLQEHLERTKLLDKPPEQLVDGPGLRAFYHDRLREFNKPLSDVEMITAFTLLARPFSQENGELTPTLKLRRKVVQEHYREQIEAMYGE